MKQLNRIKGGEGEEIAAEYLRKLGFRIIEMNHQTKFGEIDLITCKNDILIFVEVKLKTNEEFGTPEEMIGKNKLIQVKRTAEMYLLNNPDTAEQYDRYQIDAICIVQNTGRVTHYQNITQD